ncbi:GtrA family protein [Celerinatantimonas sp. MCCC 1A17872]|uniref:GtrA family protein n=1 Tax=Celerinatantimonas sp. MCCC 1A17872 TaxID=3177514 RepID=UPI0038CB1584
MEMFFRYGFVGCFNTAIHWLVFFIAFKLIYLDQSLANVLGFFVTVSFSYCMNSFFTFRANLHIRKYLLYICFMAIIYFLIGYIAGQLNGNPFLTLIISSGINFLFGFFVMKKIVLTVGHKA